MNERGCHGPNDSPRERARLLVLKTYGVKRVAGWCSVAEDTVYQWLSRGTDREPVPAARVAQILAGARTAGLEAPLDVLWPAMAAHSNAEPVP